MKIKEVNNGSLDAETFFGERDKAFLLASAPDSKLTLNLNYSQNKFDAGISVTRYSAIELLDFQMFEPTEDYGSFANKIAAATDSYNPKVVTDVVLGYEICDGVKLNVGANNIFNEYPNQQDDWVEGGGYWDAVQMGFGGAYFYTRLGFTF
jgi:iron complex outermembrane receptor protein